MFQICINLEEVGFTGLKALDERRRLRLPDNSIIRFLDYAFVFCEVPEWFARAHFDNQQAIKIIRVVPISVLVPGDVVIDENDPNIAHLAALEPARIQQLWLAGKPVE